MNRLSVSLVICFDSRMKGRIEIAIALRRYLICGIVLVIA